MRIVLVRHAESVGNVQRRLQGSTDSELTEHGVQQAARVGAALGRIRRVESSPLRRALRTARAISPSVDVRDELREVSFGSREDAEWRSASGPQRGGESPEAAARRARGVVSRWLWLAGQGDWRDESLCIVSHGVFLSRVMEALEARSGPLERTGFFRNASISELDLDPAATPVCALRRWNDVSHLVGLRRCAIGKQAADGKQARLDAFFQKRKADTGDAPGDSPKRARE